MQIAPSESVLYVQQLLPERLFASTAPAFQLGDLASKRAAKRPRPSEKHQFDRI